MTAHLLSAVVDSLATGVATIFRSIWQIGSQVGPSCDTCDEKRGAGACSPAEASIATQAGSIRLVTMAIKQSCGKKALGQIASLQEVQESIAGMSACGCHIHHEIEESIAGMSMWMPYTSGGTGVYCRNVCMWMPYTLGCAGVYCRNVYVDAIYIRRHRSLLQECLYVDAIYTRMCRSLLQECLHVGAIYIRR